MAIDVRNGTDQSVTHLVTGIVSDLQDLIKQQLALFRSEVRNDVQKAREAAIPLIIGLSFAMVGAGLLVLMLVHLLHWATPIPMWGCYAIVGAGSMLLGGALYYGGMKKLESIHPLPEESAQALKENVQCLMNPK
jgi:uncharacterized membrane protein YqjE